MGWVGPVSGGLVCGRFAVGQGVLTRAVGRGKRRRGTETNPGWSYASGSRLLLAVVAPENERDGVDGDEPGEEGEFAG